MGHIAPLERDKSRVAPRIGERNQELLMQKTFALMSSPQKDFKGKSIKRLTPLPTALGSGCIPSASAFGHSLTSQSLLISFLPLSWFLPSPPSPLLQKPQSFSHSSSWELLISLCPFLPRHASTICSTFLFTYFLLILLSCTEQQLTV